MPRETKTSACSVLICLLIANVSYHFRNVLANPRNAVVPSVRLVHDALHILIDRSAKHHDQRLQLLPPDSHPWDDGCNAVGPLRDSHWARGTAQEKVQSEYLKYVTLSNGNTFTHILNI